MAILKEYASKKSCEVEINVNLVNEESVKFQIHFRFGKSFSVVHAEIVCLKRDFLRLLDDLEQLDIMHLSMLEFHDPGLCIYHIPYYGPYYYPNHGFLHIPEEDRAERDTYFTLIFVLDAGELNNRITTGCGPSLCIKVKKEQIIEFVESLRLEVNRFK